MSERSTCDECLQQRKLTTYYILNNWDGHDILAKKLCKKCRSAYREDHPRCSFWRPKSENYTKPHYAKRTFNENHIVRIFKYWRGWLYNYDNNDGSVYEKFETSNDKMYDVLGYLRKLRDGEHILLKWL